MSLHMFSGVDKEAQNRGRKFVAADRSGFGESLRVDGAKLRNRALDLIVKPGNQFPGLKTSTRLALRLPDLLLLRAEGVAAGISKETIENARQMLEMETREATPPGRDHSKSS